MTDDYYSSAGIPSGSVRDARTDPGKRTKRNETDVERGFPYSPQSLVHASTHDDSAPSSLSSPNNQGLFPTSPALLSELSGESSPTPELSPNPERSQINSSQRDSGHSTMGVPSQQGNLGPQHLTENPRMQPNLGMSRDNKGRRGSHVMSWMSYGDGDAGPTG